MKTYEYEKKNTHVNIAYHHELFCTDSRTAPRSVVSSHDTSATLAQISAHATVYYLPERRERVKKRKEVMMMQRGMMMMTKMMMTKMMMTKMMMTKMMKMLLMTKILLLMTKMMMTTSAMMTTRVIRSPWQACPVQYQFEAHWGCSGVPQGALRLLISQHNRCRTGGS